MSDKLRRAGLVRGIDAQKPAPTQKPPEAVAQVQPPKLPRAVVAEPIAKKDKEIVLDSHLKLKITESGEKFKVHICTSDAILPLVVSANGSEAVGAELEISKNQKAQLYISAEGKLSRIEINATDNVNAELKPVEEIPAGKIRERAFGQDEINQKAIVLESGERLVYVKETGVILVFKEAYKYSVHEAKDEEWTSDIGEYRVWYDPAVPDYRLAIGHKREIAKVREVNEPKIEFSLSEAHFGATKGAMSFDFAAETIRVGVEVDSNRELTPRTNQRAKKQGIELVGSGKIRVEKIVGREATTQGNGESWVYEPENKIEILRSKVTDCVVVVNKETEKASIVVTNTADPLKAEYLKDEKTASPVTGRSGRSTFNKDGKTYELNLMNGSVMLTEVKASQPAAVAAPAPSTRVAPAASEVKTRAGPIQTTQGAKRAVAPAPGRKAAIEADDKEEKRAPVKIEEEHPKSGLKTIVAVLVAFGAAYFGVREYRSRQTPQERPAITVPAVPRPQPEVPPIVPIPPIITPPPVETPAPAPIVQDAGTTRDATADTNPVRRRRSSGNSSGYGSFEGM